MSFLRELGLAAALLAATGGAAIATWNYISAKRRKEEEQDCHPQQERGPDHLHCQKTPQPPIVPQSSKDPTTAHCAERGTSEEQRGQQGSEPATLLVPVHKERAEGVPTVREGNTARPQTSAVQAEGERSDITHTVQVDRRSQTERSDITHTVQVDRRSQTERSDITHTVQVDRRSQTERSAVQVEGEREGIPYKVQVDERSAVQVEGERSESAHTVQVDRRSAVQVEGERSESAHTVQVDRRSAVQRSAVQVEGERERSEYTVLEDMRADLLTSPVDVKELSDSNICTEIQPQVKASLRKQVVVLGLDGSGKTSVLNSIAANKGKFVTTPTAGVNALCVNNGTSKMEFLEIGGSEHLRPYWKMYLSRAFAVIFVVDSADHGRLPLAKRHLHQLIQQDAIIPLMVLANKQDLKNAYHITEIHEALGLSDICENRKLFLIGTYAAKEESEISSGILDAKEFLAQLLAESSANRL
ncbi:ADP-ribosylation factor-like protein 9 [Mantella aurantiaca]